MPGPDPRSRILSRSFRKHPLGMERKLGQGKPDLSAVRRKKIRLVGLAQSRVVQIGGREFASVPGKQLRKTQDISRKRLEGRRRHLPDPVLFCVDRSPCTSFSPTSHCHVEKREPQKHRIHKNQVHMLWKYLSIVITPVVSTFCFA